MYCIFCQRLVEIHLCNLLTVLAFNVVVLCCVTVAGARFIQEQALASASCLNCFKQLGGGGTFSALRFFTKMVVVVKALVELVTVSVSVTVSVLNSVT